MAKSGTPSIPKAPNPAKTYQKGIDVYLRNNPKLLAGEQAAREQYDPQRIAEQQRLQDQFGPKMYQQQLDALHTLDPVGTSLRTDLGNKVTSDLNLGTQLDPAYERQLQQEIRSAQSARGATMGNAPANAEALYVGGRAQDLYQRRLANAGTFLSSPTPEQQLLTVGSVQPDRSAQYVNPNAGYLGQQFGLNNYQNLLAQQAASGGSQNPWMGALQGAGTGASMGSIGGVYGMAGGAIIGGVAGGLGYPQFSDKRLKTKISDLYKTKLGLNLKTFEYKDEPGKKYAGYMAQDLEKIRPDAVGEVAGYKTVTPEFAPIPLPA